MKPSGMIIPGKELVREMDVAAPRYTSYPTIPVWAPADSGDAFAEVLRRHDAATPLTLYFHVPFCPTICHYCGCNTSRLECDAQTAEYAAALLNQARPCMRMYSSRGMLPEDANARGVVFHTVKFCDYYSFEYHNIKNSKGTPILKIETDCTPQSSGQLRTRLDAFAETLDAGVKRVEKTGSNGSARYTAGVDSGSTSTDAS